MSVEDVISQLKVLLTDGSTEPNLSDITTLKQRNVPLHKENNFNKTFDLSNWTSQYYALFDRSTAEWKIIVLFFYCLIVLVSFFGNSIVCKIIFWNSAMRSTTNIYIGSLSVSDLLMTVFNIPLQLTQILSRNWPLNKFLCRCMPFFQSLSVNVSSFTMACIALDRYQIIAHPLKPRPSMTSIILKLNFIWIMAMLASSPYPAIANVEDDFTYSKVTRCRLIYPEPKIKMRLTLTLITMTIQYLGPLLITGFTYYKICFIIWNRRTIGVMSERQKIRRYMAKWKTIRMLIIVFVVFSVCWLPINIYHIYQDFRGIVGLNKHNPIIFLFCHWFAMSSICYNPFVYCWLNNGFRAKAKTYLLWFLLFKPKSYNNLNVFCRTKSDKTIYKHCCRSSAASMTMQSKYSYRIDLAETCSTLHQSKNRLADQVNSTPKKENARSFRNDVENKKHNFEFPLEINRNLTNYCETEV